MIVEIEVPDSPFLPVLRALVTRAEPLSRDAAAELAGMQPRTFTRAFAREFGGSFRELQHEIKLQVATCLLLHTGLSIVRVGERIGYSDPRKFRVAFKKRFGASPSDYRERRRRSPLKRAAKMLVLLRPMSLKCRILLRKIPLVIKPAVA